MDAEARMMNGLPAVFSDTRIRWVAQLRGGWAYPVTRVFEKAPAPKF